MFRSKGFCKINIPAKHHSPLLFSTRGACRKCIKRLCRLGLATHFHKLHLSVPGCIHEILPLTNQSSVAGGEGGGSGTT